MTMTLQVAYPVTEGTTFDYDYYFDTHMKMVEEHMGAHIAEAFASRGVSGPPGQPAPFHAIATMKFADQAALNEALGASGPVMADIPNFTNSEPQVMVGHIG
ncbi:EthD family reductase [Marinibacterium profundimaris]|uniref:Ethyl tert-butyl ether degradation protein EthD n=1 Tax=Marinibacterium profundimaris TaxID=1679460 RepID=A0A225NS26_9RHOB|nr:EthD family reductase [Marinibacterium profundimaris]OWU77645.1 ethyl tert-butyl ether degradation protein EthD [Marinibacterium profundimaris]